MTEGQNINQVEGQLHLRLFWSKSISIKKINYFEEKAIHFLIKPYKNLFFCFPCAKSITFIVFFKIYLA